MANLSLCRVCLASNVRMYHIANTRYQEIFEKLATKLRTEDGRPETICYICFSQLRKCSRFVDMSRKAEEIVTQLSHSGIELTEETVTILNKKFVRKMTWTPLQIVCINDESSQCSQVKVEIKQEPHENLQLIVKDEPIVSETQKQATERHEIHIVKEEPVSEIIELISENKELVSENRELVSENNELVSENEELVSEIIVVVSENEKPTIKEEGIKQELMEYEDELAGEFELTGPSEENRYDDVNVTNPEQNQACARFYCHLCEKSYKRKFHLYRHIKTHGLISRVELTGLPAREFTCEICGKAFIQRSTLTKHLYLHKAVKRFACDTCPSRFSDKNDMLLHMRKHTGQKPFTCDVCKKTFSRKNNMRLHILTHADCKPFECHVCSGTFSRRYDLNRHIMRKHTGEKPFKCDICHFRSANASSVKRHKLNKHLKNR